MSRTRKIRVDDLRTGMYVAALDRPWLETPFLMQGFEVQGADDIRVVSQYCDFVYVDDAFVPGKSDKSAETISAETAPEHLVPVEEEHLRIAPVFEGARASTKTMLDSLRSRRTLDAESMRRTVDDCVDSVLRNPDALLWMSRIREESEYTAEHSLNVCVLAVAFGRHLGFSQRELELLGLCGLLHDIGKMRVPEEILNKPGPLTKKEMNMMKAHTVHGRNLLLQTPSIDPIVIDVAYSHHERIDGAGYPRKIPAVQASRFARMVAIVDAYDAMVADRCYSKAIPTNHALRNLYQDRGSHFDEELVLKFIQSVGLFPVGSIVELYTGEVGIVIETNPRRRHLPRVITVLDAQKTPKDRYQDYDLIHVEEGALSRDHLIKQVVADGTYGVRLRHYQEEGVLLKY